MKVPNCLVCNKSGNLTTCSKCKLADYCSTVCQLADYGHAVMCVEFPKVVAKSKALIDNYNIQSYTTRPAGPFLSSEAQTQRGDIVEEEAALQLCYHAVSLDSVSELESLLRALEQFPLSTEAWGMLGFYFFSFAEKHANNSYECFKLSLEMFEIAIRCARVLNPTWTDNRQETFNWAQIYNRSYLRALSGRATALKKLGRTKEACLQAMKFLKWCPQDNLRVSYRLCNWFLEIGDTENLVHLFREFGTDSAFSAYSDVLVQFLRWKREDIFEDNVKEALCKALKVNPFVPFLLLERFEPESFDYSDMGGPMEARYYVNEAYHIWSKHYPDSIEWLRSCQYPANSPKKPSEESLIKLLRSGRNFVMDCTHTNKRGKNIKKEFIRATQKKDECFGCRLETFEWPSHLNNEHKNSDPIWLHDNDVGIKNAWRVTTYSKVDKVPFWEIILHYGDDEEEY